MTPLPRGGGRRRHVRRPGDILPPRPGHGRPQDGAAVGQASERGDDLGIQVGGSKQRVAHGESGGDRITTRVVGDVAGYTVDWTQITSQINDRVSELAKRGNRDPLKDVPNRVVTAHVQAENHDIDGAAAAALQAGAGQDPRLER